MSDISTATTEVRDTEQRASLVRDRVATMYRCIRRLASDGIERHVYGYAPPQVTLSTIREVYDDALALHPKATLTERNHETVDRAITAAIEMLASGIRVASSDSETRVTAGVAASHLETAIRLLEAKAMVTP